MQIIRKDATIELVRSTFIETLSEEFIALTGYGAYAFLNPLDINRLFNQYLEDTRSLREFTKNLVRQSLPL